MPLRIFNTLTQRKQRFQTREAGIVKMFVCGPTVYDFIHLGHARTYLAFDIMARYLQNLGYAVRFVVNITDLDDHVFERARAVNVSYERLAGRYARAFFADLRALGVRSVTRFPRASRFVDPAMQHISSLMHRRFAYIVDGWVFFDTTRSRGYGRLSGQTPDDLELRRLDAHPAKRSQVDFLLWRGTLESPRWKSPFGPGRPGWHIEDTAMALGCFGGPYDIHGGATDLVFPHHEALIAQGEALTGVAPIVGFWLHTGTLNVGATKMSKSVGNVVRVRDALQQYPADVLRILFLGAHYRDPFVLHTTELEVAAQRLATLRRASGLARKALVKSSRAAKSSADLSERVRVAHDRFDAAMNDDFDTPLALQVALDLALGAERELNYHPPIASVEQFGQTFAGMLRVFGILQESQITAPPQNRSRA